MGPRASGTKASQKWRFGPSHLPHLLRRDTSSGTPHSKARDGVGMSLSSLHHHFSSVTAMTPMQYEKRLRLHEARRLMLVERLDAGLATLARGQHDASLADGCTPIEAIDREGNQ
jgi:methylphosphotriester-DNA--protein-cysteine methyltransferase